MKKHFFQWDTYAGEHGVTFPAETLEELFLIDVRENTVWLARKTAELLFGSEPVLSLQDFEKLISEQGRVTFCQGIQRLMMGKTGRASCHAAVRGKSEELSSMIYLFRLEQPEKILGFLSVDYEPIREYDEQLVQVRRELERVQKLNGLILEGASDYIYQLDVVNNICTFSSNALEVLPLENPTFSDAMNRILSFIIPEDRQIFLDSFTPFLTGKSDTHTAEYRVLTKQGEIMWISCRGKGEHDEQGNPLVIAGSLQDITENKKHEEKIQKMLYYDILTGLKNRRCFEKDLKERMEQPASRGSILYMDVRKFKMYNELFGHNFGNKILKEIANMLPLYFPEALGIYRFSGDEYLVHLKEYEQQEILAKLAPFQANLRRMREVGEHSLYIGICTAIAVYPDHGTSVEELMKNANQCLYRLSQQQKGEVSFFDADMGNPISRQFHLENEIRKDIEQGFRHFRVVYQPIVQLDADGANWIGAEALLRYRNPELGDIDQMELIRTLEYSGLILPVGRWVIERAVQECSRWNNMGGQPIVHVNVAAQQVSDSGLVQHIRKCCREQGLPLERLVLELTETSMVDNFDMATHFCGELLDSGCGIALDDFGTGYSSFSYLKTLPLSQIKVDREYTRQIQSNRYNQIIISSLYRLAEDLKIGLCVEGVETEDELQIMREMGVKLIQGFYFERPLEADVMEREFPRRMKQCG